MTSPTASEARFPVPPALAAQLEAHGFVHQPDAPYPERAATFNRPTPGAAADARPAAVAVVTAEGIALFSNAPEAGQQDEGPYPHPDSPTRIEGGILTLTLDQDPFTADAELALTLPRLLAVFDGAVAHLHGRAGG